MSQINSMDHTYYDFCSEGGIVMFFLLLFSLLKNFCVEFYKKAGQAESGSVPPNPRHLALWVLVLTSQGYISCLGAGLGQSSLFRLLLQNATGKVTSQTYHIHIAWYCSNSRFIFLFLHETLNYLLHYLNTWVHFHLLLYLQYTKTLAQILMSWRDFPIPPETQTTLQTDLLFPRDILVRKPTIWAENLTHEVRTNLLPMRNRINKALFWPKTYIFRYYEWLYFTWFY